MLQTQVGEITVTIDDACEIKVSVDQFLKTAEIADPVPPLEDPDFEAFDTILFGAWRLIDDDDDPEGLKLVYWIAVTQSVRVRQDITIKRGEDGRWKAVSTGRVFYHMRPH